MTPSRTRGHRGFRLGKASSLFAKVSGRSLFLLILLGAVLGGLADRQWHWVGKVMEEATPWTDSALAVSRHLMVRPREAVTAPAPQVRAPAPENRASPATPTVVEAPSSPAPSVAATKARGYSLQIASFQSRERSLKYTRALRAQGLDAFTVPAEIPQKGTWYRVILGRFESAEHAAETARELRKKGTIEAAEIISLPFAVEVVGASAEQAAQAEAVARTSGYLAAKSSERTQPSATAPDTVRVDAFATQNEADRLVDVLRAKGLSTRVTQR